MCGAGCAKSLPSHSAEACGPSNWKEADRPIAQPRGDGDRSTGSHAQCAPRLRPLPSISTGQAGTTHKRRLNIGTPCSHHGAQAVTQETQSGAQLVFDAARRLFYLARNFRLAESLKDRQLEQPALRLWQAMDQLSQQMAAPVNFSDVNRSRHPEAVFHERLKS